MVALATEFAQLASELRAEPPDEATADKQWRRLGELAVAHVPGCSWSSITELHAGKARSLAASDPVAELLDQLQYELGEGPCLYSADADSSVLCPDIDAELRWPRFAARARQQTPLRSLLAIRLPGRDAAAMNFYADRTAAFDNGSLAAASILAAHAAGLLVVGETAEHSLNLEVALSTSRQIGMAMGVLMAHHKITEDEAFALLRLASQALHRKLRDIAAEVAETGTLPELPVRARSATRAGRTDGHRVVPGRSSSPVVGH